MVFRSTLISSLALASAVRAGIPPTPEGITVVNSTVQAGAYLSYKETKICETTEGVKSYAGYVHLPPNPQDGQDYPIHTFFWFFGARNNATTAPLTIWLQGGPGSPSTVSAVSANGPCAVAKDSKTTELNPYSWNTDSNLLYIDQPVQTGFSYDTLHNGTLDELFLPFLATTGDFKTDAVPESTLTKLTGTFYSQKNETSTNTTMQASRALWHFLQTWTEDFPGYESVSNPEKDTFHMWGESYGGHYIPITANLIMDANEKVKSGEIAKPAKQLHVETLGLINACIDGATQIPFYPEMAYNNTYGIQAIDEKTYEQASGKIDNCMNLIKTCQNLADANDPTGTGLDAATNFACHRAYKTCFDDIGTKYPTTRNVFDIASPAISSFTPKWAAGYLNRAEVQQALGVPLNFTGLGWAPSQTFQQTGDFFLGHGLKAIGRLLDNGAKVALVYGDRDYQCNWLGGEAISLNIKSSKIPSGVFSKAGYTNIQTNASYIGGLARQVGRLSFSRIFNAGHAVPYYQPQTALEIFNRVTFNKDVATGEKSSDGFTSSGLSTAWTTDGPNKAPAYDSFPQDCYLWDVMETCQPEQAKVLKEGKPIVRDFILVGYTADNGTDVYYPGYSKEEAGTPTNGGPSPTGSPSSSARPTTGAGVGLVVSKGVVGMVAIFAGLLMI